MIQDAGAEDDRKDRLQVCVDGRRESEGSGDGKSKLLVCLAAETMTTFTVVEVRIVLLLTYEKHNWIVDC